MSEINRRIAKAIATNQALHKEAQDVLEEKILLELQIAEKRGEVIARVRITELENALETKCESCDLKISTSPHLCTRPIQDRCDWRHK